MAFPCRLSALLLLAACPAAFAEPLTVDPLSGSIRVILKREGLLKALGHDHLVVAAEFRGSAEIAESSASIRVEVDAGRLEIDEPGARREAGLAQEVSVKDRAKIRERMRGESGLDVLRRPLAAFTSESAVPEPGRPGVWAVRGAFSLRGSTRTIDFPVTLTPAPDGWWAEGAVTIRSSDFGILPFSVAGLIKVRDEAEIRFRLALRRGELFGTP